MNSKCVLVISNKVDVHADSVIDALYTLGAEVVRLNTEDFRQARYCLSIGNNGLAFDFETSGGRAIAPKDVHSVYVRRISRINTDDVEDDYKQLVSDESEVLLNAFCELFSESKWLDFPQYRIAASNKILQLMAARESGFAIPSSVITNNEESAKKFLAEGESIFKTLRYPIVDFGERGVGMINTTLIRDDLIDSVCSQVSVTANYFQHYVSKLYELRVHVIGGDIVAVKIESQSNADSKIDWRVADFDYLDYEEVVLPGRVQGMILEFMARLRLNFGVLDMIVTPEEEYVFLEINPNGNWTWLEPHLNTSVSHKIASWLVKE
ncbi:MAG: MvdC/MvdD family ATP grasp protein [Candidatus Komeilibacteria bacterium]